MDEIKLPQDVVNRVERRWTARFAQMPEVRQPLERQMFVAIARKLRSSPIAASLASVGRILKAADDRKTPRQPSRSLSEPAALERSQRGCSHASGTPAGLVGNGRSAIMPGIRFVPDHWVASSLSIRVGEPHRLVHADPIEPLLWR
jgi:hypothetical protein